MAESVATVAARPLLVWPRALALAAVAVYGPQLAMGVFTLCRVSCEHCRVTVWKMMAVAPGVETAVGLCMIFKIRHLTTSDTTNLFMVAAFSILALFGVTALLRRWTGSRWLVFSGFTLAFSAGAFLLLAMIRA